MHNCGLNPGWKRKNVILPLVHANKPFNLHQFVSKFSSAIRDAENRTRQLHSRINMTSTYRINIKEIIKDTPKS